MVTLSQVVTVNFYSQVITVNFYLLLLFVELMCLTFTSLLQNQNNSELI